MSLIPQPVVELSRNLEFWSHWFWFTEADSDTDEGPYPQLDDLSVEYPAGDGYALVQEFDDWLSFHSLNLRVPGREELVEIGWDDQAHWHPHVLRWWEVDAIGRRVALLDPTLPHPGLPVLLLCRFAPISLGEEPERIFPLLRAALETIPIDEDFRNAVVERTDRRAADYTWTEEINIGWTLSQPVPEGQVLHSSGIDLYTLRHRDNEEFPFVAMQRFAHRVGESPAECVDRDWLGWSRGTVENLAVTIAKEGDLSVAPILGDALRDAGCTHETILAAFEEPIVPVRACWVAELLLESELGTGIARCLGDQAPRLRERHSLAVDITTWTPDFEMDRQRVREAVAALNEALGEERLGGAEVNGGGSSRSPEGERLSESTHVGIHVFDDLEAGIAVIRRVLIEHEVHPETQIAVYREG